MSGQNEILWCDKCQDYKSFDILGTTAICSDCEVMVGEKRLEELRKKQYAHEISEWVLEPLKRIIKKQVDIARKF